MELLSPRITRPSRKGPLFVTFYSFKGGVGRTMALLSAAAVLAGRGKRVLMIDFDLEAPGLTLFQDAPNGPKLSRDQPGLLDAIHEFIDAIDTSPVGGGDGEAFFDVYTTALPIPESARRVPGGRLDLVPSGRLDQHYEDRLYGVSFSEMFAEGVGAPFFKRLRALLERAGRYDYVLIDSRTGFSDEGSICTRYLSDHLVVLTGLNRQNIRGTARFLRRSGVSDRGDRVAVVASPVPLYNEDLRAERLEVAEAMLAEVGLDHKFAAIIPYHPRLALDEDPRVYDFLKTDLAVAYRQIVELLQTWAHETPRERISEAFGLWDQGERDRAMDLFRQIGREEPEQAVDAILTVAPFLSSQEDSERALPLLKLGLDIAEGLDSPGRKGALLTHLGNQRIQAKAYDEAISYHTRALSLSREIASRESELIDLRNLARATSLSDDRDGAIALYDEAIRIAHDLGDKAEEAFLLNALANTFALAEDFSTAAKWCERAIAVAQEGDNRQAEGALLNNLARHLSALGRTDDAIQRTEEAVSVAREASDREGEGRALANLAEYLHTLGQADEAITHARRALALAREASDRSGERNALDILISQLHALGQIDEATWRAEEAVGVARETGDRKDEGVALSKLSQHLAALGRADEAAHRAEEAVAVFRETGDRKDEGVALGKLSQHLAALGRADEAARSVEEALAIFREVGDRQGEGFAVGELGSRLVDLGSTERALTLYLESYAIAEETGDRTSQIIRQASLGRAHATLGHTSEAVASLATARNALHELHSLPLRAAVVVNELEALAELDPDEALGFAEETWETVATDADAFTRARAQVLRARLRAAHDDPEGAVEDAEAALALYRPNGVDSRWSREAEAIVTEHGAKA